MTIRLVTEMPISLGVFLHFVAKSARMLAIEQLFIAQRSESC